MSKSLITALGLVVSLAIVALGVFLVALPVYLQSAATDAQTATVANVNTIYQDQVDGLQAQEENLPEINASVEGLRSQISATGQLDDVFEVVAHAAESAGVTINSITAGDQVVFVARTEAGAAPAAPSDATETPDAASDDATTDGGSPAVATPAANGRQQVDFAIQATAVDFAQATAFIDAMRSGPRLLSSLQSSVTQSGTGVGVQVSALTYLDSEG